MIISHGMPNLLLIWQSIVYKNSPSKRDYFHGTPDRIRTYGLWLRKPTLYPAELQVLGFAKITLTKQDYHIITEVTRCLESK